MHYHIWIFCGSNLELSSLVRTGLRAVSFVSSIPSDFNFATSRILYFLLSQYITLTVTSEGRPILWRIMRSLVRGRFTVLICTNLDTQFTLCAPFVSARRCAHVREGEAVLCWYQGGGEGERCAPCLLSSLQSFLFASSLTVMSTVPSKYVTLVFVLLMVFLSTSSVVLGTGSGAKSSGWNCVRSL